MVKPRLKRRFCKESFLNINHRGNLINMKFMQLSYFLAVAEERSILKASLKVHVSQPSISAQVKALEEELGVQLFERARDGMRLTPEGTELVLHAKGVVAAMNAARESVKGVKADPKGQVGVGIPGSLAGLLTAPLVERVVSCYPSVQLRVVGGLSGHMRQWILDGRLDFGLVYESTGEAGLRLERLFSERLFLVVSKNHVLSREQNIPAAGVPMERIASLPLVLPGRGYAIRSLIERMAEKSSVKLTVAAEVDATDQMIDVVVRTDFCTILSLAALRTSLLAKRVVALPIAAPVLRFVSLAHANHRPLSIAAREVQKTFKELIEEKLREPWWARAITESRLLPKLDND